MTASGSVPYSGWVRPLGEGGGTSIKRVRILWLGLVAALAIGAVATALAAPIGVAAGSYAEEGVHGATMFNADLRALANGLSEAPTISYGAATNGPPPSVSGVSPGLGPAAGGTVVTVSGTNFSEVTAVKFGSVSASGFTVKSPASISVKSPAGSGVVDVTVITAAGTSATSGVDTFRYLPLPVVTGVSPDHGPSSGGLQVTVTGSNLGEATAVKFGTRMARIVASPQQTSITVEAPAGKGLVDVTVLAPGGTSATGAADQFRYIPPPPTVTKVQPSSGPAVGGTSVTLTGTNLGEATAVKFGATGAVVTAISETSITAESPPGTGLVDIHVTTPGGTSATGPADQFNYAPAVTGVNPGYGLAVGGTSVTITGTNFNEVTAVDFGSHAAVITAITETSITVESPAGTGLVDVTVTSAGGTSTAGPADKFNYGPAITSISPNKGPTGGGTLVSITGTNFSEVNAVRFGTATALSFKVESPTLITAEAPPGTGVVPVIVSSPGGASTPSTADQFNYAPQVTSISPSSGTTFGNTPVTITGSGFLPGATVTIGSQAAAVHVTSETELTATTSPTGPGSEEVVVTDTNGTSTSGPSYTYVTPPPPAVTSVSPNLGTTLGGASVTIQGSGFLAGATVTIGSQATAVHVVSGTELTAMTSATAAGSDEVVVTDTNGTSTGGPFYTYLAPQPPEWGRCKKVTLGTGLYGSSGCTALGGKKTYEWYPWGAGLPAPQLGFSTHMVAGTGVVLETVRKAKLTCTGATGNGEYTGPKSIGNVTVVLTGCISSGLECNTEGANEGEVRIAGLEGELGWENQALRKVAEDLFPAGKPESIEQVSCGGVPVAMRGSVLSSIKAGSMLSLATVKYVQKAGKQKPEKLEGEPRDVLEMSIAAGPFEQAGETANLTRTNEEKIEANWLA